MSYTVIGQGSAEARGVVVPTVIDALSLARTLGSEDEREPIIFADNGWMLTMDELEELAKP
jgi:hypothetical protein